MGTIINILVVLLVTAFRYRKDIKEASEARRAKRAKKFGRLGDFNPGTYSNRRGTRKVKVKVHSNGSTSVDVGDLLSQPHVQEQLKAVEELFRIQTISAIHQGTTPPHAVGKGTYNRRTLLADWDDDWETLARGLGIKLFERRNTVGTPGHQWVDARPEKTLEIKTSYADFIKSTGSNPLPQFRKPTPPPNPPPPPHTTKVIR